MAKENYFVLPVKAVVVREFIEANHYSKNINGCKITQCYALYEKHHNKLIGAALFGELSTTAWKKYGKTEKDVLELRRLVTLDGLEKNMLSWFVSRTMKHIKSEYNYKTCVSYADPYHGHAGYVYQSTNWSYHGVTPKDSVLVTPEGKTYHSRAMRTKYKGVLKPFAQRLKKLYDNGLLKTIKTPGKHIYTYALDGKQKVCGLPYPKLNE